MTYARAYMRERTPANATALAPDWRLRLGDRRCERHEGHESRKLEHFRGELMG